MRGHEIQTIDVEGQVDKGLDHNVKSYFAAMAICHALPFKDNEGNNLKNSPFEHINDEIKIKYPNGPTADLLEERDGFFELYSRAYLERRAEIFRNIGGLVTLETLESTDGFAFSIDNIVRQLANESGQLRTRTAWDFHNLVPEEYVEMFGITRPERNEIAPKDAKVICFHDHGEYFFPVFQFGDFKDGKIRYYYEGDPAIKNIEAVQRILDINNQYPSSSNVHEWVNEYSGIAGRLHQFVRNDKFDPRKLWDIFVQDATYKS